MRWRSYQAVSDPRSIFTTPSGPPCERLEQCGGDHFSADTPSRHALSIAVAASPTSVTAGQPSVITATLTGDGKAGVTVTFTLPVNNSGASLSASSAVTDGSGNAVVTYQAGGNNPTNDVADTVRASVGSISGSTAITRTGKAPLAYVQLLVRTPRHGVSLEAVSSLANVEDSNGSVWSRAQPLILLCTNGDLTRWRL